MSETLSLARARAARRIQAGDDLGALIAARSGPLAGTLVAIAHTVVSKAEGAVRELADVVVGERAREIAERQARDPRLVQVILDESSEIVRDAGQVLVCQTRQGFICANAGVDLSNAGADERAVLLPRDADASARAIRARLSELTGESAAVLVTDSFGRAWRHGQLDVAIGLAGMPALDDWRGRRDSEGRVLNATWLAIADAAAAAADLARAKDSGEPVVLIEGLSRHLTAEDGPGARRLLRGRGEDLFR